MLMCYLVSPHLAGESFKLSLLPEYPILPTYTLDTITVEDFELQEIVLSARWSYKIEAEMYGPGPQSVVLDVKLAMYIFHCSPKDLLCIRADWECTRIRHIKCDETKPACLKCTNTGRKCDGYISSPVSSPLSACGLSMYPNMDTREHRAFDYFLKCTAPDLTGFFSLEIWGIRVPRLSTAGSPLWHIVVALSSAHEGFASGSQYPRGNAPLAAYDFALQHYSLSVKGLQETMSSKSDNLELVLLCCALFVCFDSLRGNYKAASTHLMSGLNILSGQKATGKLRQSDDAIIQIFTCLGVQAGSFIDSYFPGSAVEGLTKSIWSQLFYLSNQSEQSTFCTMDDARHSLNMLLVRFMLQLTQLQTPSHYSGYEPTSQTSISGADLTEWSRSFDAMILRKRTINLSSSDLRASILLKLHHASISAITDAAEANTMCPQTRNAPFQTIISLSRSLINATVSSTNTKASISSDLGLVGPLFMTISRCTVTQLRWEALALLKAVPRREGMWDADIAAKIAKGVLDIEEQEKIDRVNHPEESNVEIQGIRMQYNEDSHLGLRSSITVDFDFAKTDVNTRLRTQLTKRIFTDA